VETRPPWDEGPGPHTPRDKSPASRTHRTKRGGIRSLQSRTLIGPPPPPSGIEPSNGVRIMMRQNGPSHPSGRTGGRPWLLVGPRSSPPRSVRDPKPQVEFVQDFRVPPRGHQSKLNPHVRGHFPQALSHPRRGRTCAYRVFLRSRWRSRDDHSARPRDSSIRSRCPSRRSKLFSVNSPSGTPDEVESQRRRGRTAKRYVKTKLATNAATPIRPTSATSSIT